MAFGPLIDVLLRWWWLTVAVLLVAAGAGAGAALLTPVTYSDTAKVLLLPSPKVPGVAETTNPFLQFDGSLMSTADIVSLLASTPKVADEIATKHLSEQFTVGLDNTTQAPIVEVNALSRSSDQARTTVDALVDIMQRELAEKQQAAGAPQNSWVRVYDLVRSPRPERVYTGQVRTGIMAGLGAVLAGLALIFTLERRRRIRRGIPSTARSGSAAPEQFAPPAAQPGVHDAPIAAPVARVVPVAAVAPVAVPVAAASSAPATPVPAERPAKDPAPLPREESVPIPVPAPALDTRAPAEPVRADRDLTMVRERESTLPGVSFFEPAENSATDSSMDDLRGWFGDLASPSWLARPSTQATESSANGSGDKSTAPKGVGMAWLPQSSPQQEQPQRDGNGTPRSRPS